VAVAIALGIFLLLQAAFNSWRLAILAFVALPMALAGGLLAVVLTGGELSIGSAAGLLGVFALAVRGTVALIRHYQHLERREGRPFGRDLVHRGTRDRLAPMLITTFAAAVVFVPFLFAGDAAGLEIVQPMAVVILGGVVTSTLLNLVVVPALYLRYGFVLKPDTSAEELFVVIPEVETVTPVQEGTPVGEGTSVGEVR
jgi:Cu/Ag efflux pump CusA